MVLLAVRAIDFAIFGTLGTLWITGGVFIYFLYRWILRFEAGGRTTDAPVPYAPADRETPSRHRAPAADGALGSARA